MVVYNLRCLRLWSAFFNKSHILNWEMDLVLGLGSLSDC